MNKLYPIRKKRWLDLYERDGAQKKFVLLMNYPNEMEDSRPMLWPDKKQERVDWALRKYELAMQRANVLDDDYIPYLDVTTGTEIYAEVFGCDVYRAPGDMPVARPLIKSSTGVKDIKAPMLESSPLMLMFEIADELREKAGAEAAMNMPDVQCPMDIAAQIWDKTEFFASMISDPQAVKELAGMTKQLLVEFLDEWFRRYGTEYIAHHPSYYMEGGHSITIDEVGCISAEMFEEYFLQDTNELSRRYGGIGVHCCADSIHQWDGFMKIEGLRLLNLYQPDEVISKAYRFFSPHTAHWHGALSYYGARPIKNMAPEDYPDGARAVIVEQAENLDDAKRKCETLRKVYG